MDLAGAGQKAHKQRPDRAAASLVHVKIEEKFILAPFGIDWGVWGPVVMPFLLSRVFLSKLQRICQKSSGFLKQYRNGFPVLGKFRTRP